MKHVISGALAMALLAASPAWPAGPQIKKQTVQFQKGKSEAVIKGGIKGEQVFDYVLRANAGQTMTVKLKGGSSTNFNVLPPGSDEAIFIGSTSGTDFSGALPAKGDYTIRLYQMGGALKSGKTAAYTLTIGINGAATPDK